MNLLRTLKPAIELPVLLSADELTPQEARLVFVFETIMLNALQANRECRAGNYGNSQSMWHRTARRYASHVIEIRTRSYNDVMAGQHEPDANFYEKPSGITGPDWTHEEALTIGPRLMGQATPFEVRLAQVFAERAEAARDGQCQLPDPDYGGSSAECEQWYTLNGVGNHYSWWSRDILSGAYWSPDVLGHSQ